MIYHLIFTGKSTKALLLKNWDLQQKLCIDTSKNRKSRPEEKDTCEHLKIFISQQDSNISLYMYLYCLVICNLCKHLREKYIWYIITYT
jgi:hypothetical protein